MNTRVKIKLFVAVLVAGLLGYLGNALLLKGALNEMSQRLADVESFRAESEKQVSKLEEERLLADANLAEYRLKIASLENGQTAAAEKTIEKRVSELEQYRSAIEPLLATQGDASLIARINKMEKSQTNLPKMLTEHEKAYVLFYSYVLDLGAATDEVIKKINILSFSPTPDKELDADLSRLANSVRRMDANKPKGTKTFP